MTDTYKSHIARKHTTVALATLLIVFCLASCHHTQQITSTETHETTTSNETLLNCNAEGMSVDLLMRSQHDSVIWMTARKIIELGRMRLTKDSVECYIKVTNNHFSGTYTDLYSITGYSTSFNKIQNMIEEALANGTTQTSYTIEAPKIGVNTTLYITLQRNTHSSTPLHYPFSIPQSSKPIWTGKK